MLVAAFRATLEEVIEADLILHVRDIAHEETEAQARDVEKVLGDLGIDTCAGRQPHPRSLEQDRSALARGARGWSCNTRVRNARPPVLVSAATGEGDRAAARCHRHAARRGDEIARSHRPGQQGRAVQLAVRERAMCIAREDARGRQSSQVRIASEKKRRLRKKLRVARISPAPQGGG